MITGTTSNKTPSTNTPLKRKPSPRVARTESTRAAAHQTPSSRAFALNQQDAPIISPAPNAHRQLNRFAASSNIQDPATTSQAVGESASGVAPLKASRGDI